MYSLPQEIEVWYIIPALRREISRILTENYGLTLERTGNILGVSKAAVSQYMNNKRAVKVNFPADIKKVILKCTGTIAKNPEKAPKEIMKLLAYIRKSGYICEVCMKYNPNMAERCKALPACR